MGPLAQILAFLLWRQTPNQPAGMLTELEPDPDGIERQLIVDLLERCLQTPTRFTLTMRTVIRIESRTALYLAAIYGNKPIFTPHRSDACSYKSGREAAFDSARLYELGYMPRLEDVRS